MPSTLSATLEPPRELTTPLAGLIALSVGLIAANLYYAQPLAGLIGPALGLSAAAAGLVVTLTQLGYGIGLLLVVPLGDVIENRRLVLVLLAASIVALLAAATARGPLAFLLASFLVGLSSVSVQVLVPYASHLAPETRRGRVVGNVMSGLMLGIMLARPAASAVAFHASWRLVFLLSAALLLVLGAALWRLMPARHPHGAPPYAALLASMARLVRGTPVLRRRSAYQAALFGSFSLFWTVAPLLLAGPRFGFTQAGIAWFALAGVAGTVAAPLAGRLADRGHGRTATAAALLLATAALLLSCLGAGSALDRRAGIAVLVAAAILLDAGATTSLVVGQRMLFVLGPEVRSRLNGLYMASFFLAGALGSAVGAWAFARGGWMLAAGMALLAVLAALLYHAAEWRRR